MVSQKTVHRNPKHKFLAVPSRSVEDRGLVCLWILMRWTDDVCLQGEWGRLCDWWLIEREEEVGVRRLRHIPTSRCCLHRSSLTRYPRGLSQPGRYKNRGLSSTTDLIVPSRGVLKGRATPISRFASIVLDGVPGPLRPAQHT